MKALIIIRQFNQTYVLDDENFINLPDLLRVAIENKAENVYLSMKNSIAVIQAPPMIMDYLSFYKNNDGTV